MKILVLIPSLRHTSPGSRFRIEQWAPYLEQQGCRLTFASFEDDALHDVIYQSGKLFCKAALLSRALVRRAALVPFVGKYDLVLIYEGATQLGPPIIERLIRLRGVPIVYDFCDPIYLPYVSSANRHFQLLKCFGKCARICQWSAQVTVGNELLAEYARRFNQNVSVVPITIDTRLYTATPHRRTEGNNEVIVGWSGSASTVPHLESLHAALRKLARSAAFHLKVVGTAPPQLEGVPMSYTPWRKDDEVALLQSFDIGIMPLPDDPWTRLRSQLKVRQYMGVGVPAVASPIGVIPELIQDDHNGFLAQTEDEWLDRLSRLIADPALRRTIGLAGRATIIDRYSAEAWAPRFKEILERAAASRC